MEIETKNNTITLDLTREQEIALIQIAVNYILEQAMENEIDKEIEKMHNSDGLVLGPNVD